MPEDLKYPIGTFEEQEYANALYSESLKNELLTAIKVLPASLEMAILNLDAAQLATPYRPGGWTVNQVVHHVADSHIHAYTRCKHALTEKNPTIKPYDQDAWAELPDYNLPVNISLTLLHALHERWYILLKELSPADWEKTYYHPEQKLEVSLWEMLKQYAWHGNHHLAHIMHLRNSNNW